eukprot:6958187-Pyramimonas_sp.AAC.1
MGCLGRSPSATEHTASIARSEAKAFEDSAAATSGTRKTLESICARRVGCAVPKRGLSPRARPTCF